MDLTAAKAVPAPLARPVEWAAAGVLVLLLVFGAVYATANEGVSPGRVLPAAIVAGAALVIGMFASRRRPLLLVVAGAGVAVICFGQASNAGWFTTCGLIGAAVWTCSYLVAGALWAGLVGVLVVSAAISPDAGFVAWIAGGTFSLVGFATARRQRELVAQLRIAQDGLARQAQTEERARIARELHDVIAHSLTVSLMHVSAARLAIAEDAGDAERSLAEAERLGRASLDEVRHAVGTLRAADGTGTDPTAPLPGSTDLPRLLAGVRDAGVPLHATVDGDLAGLPSTVGLAAYRIVQEALTNAAKHAAGAPVTVHVAVTGPAVLIDVDSAGLPGRGHGLGLLGMRERATSIGGHCDAGPGGSGWRVHAELPISTAVTS